MCVCGVGADEASFLFHREFCSCVRSLRIVSPELAAAQCLGKQPVQCSSSEDDDGDWHYGGQSNV
jgi:hypothetical protein